MARQGLPFWVRSEADAALLLSNSSGMRNRNRHLRERLNLHLVPAESGFVLRSCPDRIRSKQRLGSDKKSDSVGSCSMSSVATEEPMSVINPKRFEQFQGRCALLRYSLHRAEHESACRDLKPVLFTSTATLKADAEQRTFLGPSIPNREIRFTRKHGSIWK